MSCFSRWFSRPEKQGERVKRVFLSFAGAGSRERGRVLEWAQRLRDAGFEVIDHGHHIGYDVIMRDLARSDATVALVLDHGSTWAAIEQTSSGSGENTYDGTGSDRSPRPTLLWFVDPVWTGPPPRYLVDMLASGRAVRLPDDFEAAVRASRVAIVEGSRRWGRDIGHSTDDGRPLEEEPSTQSGEVRRAVEVRTMEQVIRPARVAVIVLALVLIAAAPVAAAQPSRSVRPLSGGFTYPAGTACAFDVAGEPSAVSLEHGFIADTTFSDGTVLHFVRAKGAYVNVATGARYPTEDTFRDVSTYDAATNTLTGLETGQTTFSFLPGDVGPFGVVGRDGALYHFIGSLSYTYDLDTFHSTEFSYTGSVEDVCAALS